MAYLPRRQQLAIKAEATEGTDSSPGDADVVQPIMRAEWIPDIASNVRDAQATYFTQLRAVAGARKAQIKFSLEVSGSGTPGTAPSNLSAALLACGLTENAATGYVDYVPSSQSATSVTVELREGGLGSGFKSKKITGARGTFILEAAVNSVLLAHFNFIGNFVTPTDTTAFTDKAIQQPPLPFLNAGFSFHGSTLHKISKLTFDLGNRLSPRFDRNQATGYFSTVITGRVTRGTIDPEQMTAATFDYYTRIINNTEGILAFSLNGGTGNTVSLNVSKAQIIGAREVARAGVRVCELDFQANQNVTTRS